MHDKKGSLYVNWYGPFKNDLGVWSNVGASSGLAVTAIKILKSVPDVSTTNFILLEHANSSYSNSLIASTHDFSSLMVLKLSFPSSLGADIDRCGTNTATSTVNIYNIVSFTTSLMIHTSSGIIVVRNGTQVQYNISLKGPCLDKEAGFMH